MQTGFKIVGTDRDGRVVRQMFAKNMGDMGCLVLVSTTVFADVEVAANPGQSLTDPMPLQQMISKVPIEAMDESVTFVPGMKLGEKGLVQIGGVAPEIPSAIHPPAIEG